MFKRIHVLIVLAAALLLSATAFAQAPGTTTRIYFLPGTTSYTFTTNLVQGVTQGYVLGVAAHQSIYVVKSGNATVQVLGPQNNVLVDPTAQPGPWGVAASFTGDYTLVLDGQGPVTVSIYIPTFADSQSYSSIAPYYRQRINFAPGSTSYVFSVDMLQGLSRAYLLRVLAGQQLNITIQGDVTVSVLGTDGSPLPATTPQYGQWVFGIPLTGDYTLVLTGIGSDTVSIAIPPLASTPPPFYPKRIWFAPGTASYTVSLVESQGQPVPQYVLGISAGQTLYVATTGVVSTVQVYDPFGNPVSSSATPYGSLAFGISRTGDYKVVVYGSGQINITFYIPPL